MPVQDRRAKPLNVLNVVWNADHSLVLTCSSDHVVRVWGSRFGDFKFELRGHVGEIFFVIPSPHHPYLLTTLGQDKKMMFWDLKTGAMLRQFEVSEQFHDGCTNHDGSRLYAVDEIGNLHCYGFGLESEPIPDQQFYNLDFVLVEESPDGFLVDLETRQPTDEADMGFLRSLDGFHYVNYQTPIFEPQLMNPIFAAEMRETRALLEMESNGLAKKIHDASMTELIDKKVLLKRKRQGFVDSDDEQPRVYTHWIDQDAPLPIIEDSSDDNYQSENEPVVSDGTDSLSDHSPRLVPVQDTWLPDPWLEEELELAVQEGEQVSHIVDYSSDEESLSRSQDGISPSTRRSRRRRRLPPGPALDARFTSDDDFDDEEVNEERLLRPRPRVSRVRARVKRSHSDSDSHLSDMSSLVESDQPDWDDQNSDDASILKSKVKRVLSETLSESVHLTVTPPEMIPILEPSPWVNTTSSNGKYLPQLADSVVYVKSRHLAFIESSSLLSLDSDFDPNLEEIVRGTIKSLDFTLIHQQVVALLKIETITGLNMHLRLHESEMLDFLVLESVHDHNESDDNHIETLDPLVEVQLINRIKEASQDPDLILFVDPVSFQDFPTYLRFVAYPMCFQLILDRLQCHFYRSVEAVSWDIKVMSDNAVCFNEPDSYIVEQAMTVLVPLSLSILSPTSQLDSVDGVSQEVRQEETPNDISEDIPKEEEAQVMEGIQPRLRIQIKPLKVPRLRIKKPVSYSDGLSDTEMSRKKPKIEGMRQTRSQRM